MQPLWHRYELADEGNIHRQTRPGEGRVQVPVKVLLPPMGWGKNGSSRKDFCREERLGTADAQLLGHHARAITQAEGSSAQLLGEYGGTLDRSHEGTQTMASILVGSSEGEDRKRD